MAVTMIVDTLRFSKQLQDKGHFSVEQADALAETIGAVGTETLVTKGDLSGLRVEVAAVRSELKGDIAALRSELKGDIAALRSELKGDIAAL